MFDNLMYKFSNRNSKKNLKAKVEKLSKELDKLAEDTLGRNRYGYITFSLNGKLPKDESLQTQITELRDYLGIAYTEEKLAPKPKEEKK